MSSDNGAHAPSLRVVKSTTGCESGRAQEFAFEPATISDLLDAVTMAEPSPSSAADRQGDMTVKVQHTLHTPVRFFTAGGSSTDSTTESPLVGAQLKKLPQAAVEHLLHV